MGTIRLEGCVGGREGGEGEEHQAARHGFGPEAKCTPIESRLQLWMAREVCDV